MQKRSLITFSIICLLLITHVSSQSIAAQQLVYSPELYPSPFNITKLHWQITNVTEERVEFGFGTGHYWQAQTGQVLAFQIHEISNNEVYGLLNIGNLTLFNNNSRIAAELVLSIWPWFPGLVSHLDWVTVDQAATEAATSYFMNGSLEIRTSLDTKSYIYHQGPLGNQNTSLVYDLHTGILLAGYTEFFFLNDYHLGIELITITRTPTTLPSLVFNATLLVVLLSSIIIFVITNRRAKKD
ncbi:MAG: hypothetical protein ACFFD8_01995 [Candidatus Thorarchaeota archaeon]